MAYTDIDKPSDYFNTKLYTGNGSTQSITGVGFQPDFTWLKVRNAVGGHGLFDVIRGANKRLISNETSAEGTMTDGLTSFDSDGFSVGADGNTNGSSETYVSWNWLASNTTASNTDGSITSTVSANTTSGFSIVKYTGTGSGATVGHGLGSQLGMLIVKKIESGGAAGQWTVWHKGLTSPQHDEVIFLNLTNAEGDVSNDTYWNGANPTSSVFSINTNENLNENTYDYIAYCFAEKQGFSKFGSYTGNGSATDGTFVYTGFKPAFVMVKVSSGTTGNWQMQDTKRLGYNDKNVRILANVNEAEKTDQMWDILSNGFKMTTTSGNANGSGNTYIYMCFAENPFVTSTGIPTTAR